MAEASGRRVHVYTSPHLVRFNERIRIAGGLVADDRLLATMERSNGSTTAPRLPCSRSLPRPHSTCSSETPADLCVLEVGLGGRGDATNVIDAPAACAITSISLDHREMLGQRWRSSPVKRPAS